MHAVHSSDGVRACVLLKHARTLPIDRGGIGKRHPSAGCTLAACRTLPLPVSASPMPMTNAVAALRKSSLERPFMLSHDCHTSSTCGAHTHARHERGSSQAPLDDGPAGGYGLASSANMTDDRLHCTASCASPRHTHTQTQAAATIPALPAALPPPPPPPAPQAIIRLNYTNMPHLI